MKYWIKRFWSSLCICGLLLGGLFFAASLTPSLLPRTAMVQGILSGCALMAGYGLGVALRWLWRYLEMPLPGPRVITALTWMAIVICAGVAVYFMQQATQWQNTVRALMQLPPVDSAGKFSTGAVVVGTALGILLLGRLFAWVVRFFSRLVRRWFSQRLANVMGVVLAAVLFWSVVDGVIFRLTLHAVDQSFAQLNSLLDPEVPPPADPEIAGGARSLVDWEDLGKRGREFIHGTRTQQEIAQLSGERAVQPLRVYVGLPSADTARERARLALEELKRVGGFDRKYLLIITPTGSGWVDPGAINSIEHLTHGDIASVAVQYSYLLSWLSLLVEPDYGAETAQELFHEVYQYWRTLPPEKRPELYLHGLSLGSLNSERSFEIFEVLETPWQGALWSGPTFANTRWNYFTAFRNAGTPQWLPAFGNGAHVRFMAQSGKTSGQAGADRARFMRITYLQYASDPVTFFDPRALYRQPEWMNDPRGVDVSPDLRWYPVVTFLQLAVDMATADTAPEGYGHVFAPQDYVNAWLDVMNIQDWSPQALERLKSSL